MIAHWWVFVPLAVLVVGLAVYCLRDGGRRMSRLQDEARDGDNGDPS